MTKSELFDLMDTEEEFELSTVDGTYRYNKDRNRLEEKVEGEFLNSRLEVSEMLSGKVIRKPWKPKFMETYWHWNYIDDKFYPCSATFVGNSFDLVFLAFGNCFRTEKNCESGTKVRDKLIEMREENL